MKHEMRMSMTQTRLDETLAQCRAISEPADVHLTHELLIRAAPAAVWEGLTRLRLPDLPLGRLFTAGRSGRSAAIG